MKKYLLVLFTIAYCSVSAQRIYVEDMMAARNNLPQIPLSTEMIKKLCTKDGKTNNCKSIKDPLDITLRLRMDSMNTPINARMEEPGRGVPMELLTPATPEREREWKDVLKKSIDSMETLLEKEHIITVKLGRTDYHETPRYELALKDLRNRLRMPVFSNTYYHMNYREREVVRDSIYTKAGISRATTNQLLAYEKLIFEMNKKNIFEMTSISGTQQGKLSEVQNLITKEIKNLRDSIDRQFKEISDWKAKDLAKAKTATENTNINQLAVTKTQKLLSSTQKLLIDRYNSLTHKYDDQLSTLNEALKCYEFGNNATTTQEKQMQNMVAQAQLTAYVTMGSLADFCVFAHETIVKYSTK